MTPKEYKEEKEELIRESKALKLIFGGLLMETTGAASPEDIAYYQRKFKEIQDKIRRQ